ncbi:MAG: PLP-dependent aspartate aminotransferase family protein [Desulfobacteraceae bacterium]|nr:PLP-dependent aspartate aminotransferase family protein [Desulfobacteraceae bacterium]
MHIQTKCVHSGKGIDTITKGLNTPIFPSSAHEYLDTDDVIYPRYFNTINQKVIVQKICDLEGAEDGIIFSSGMAAISTALLSFIKPSDHVIFQDEIYGGSYAFIEKFFKQFKISYSFVANNAESIKSAIKPATRIIYIETPSNPLLSIIDIQAIAKIAKQNNCISIIDNTFATPINQNPIKLGIDIVIHSGTKYLGGHSDLSCGAVLTTSNLAHKIRKNASNLGGNLNALSCYMLERSLKTLSIRVKQQTENAFQIANFLDNLSIVKKVYYPGLSDHPGHSTACEQMNGFGAMLSFELDGSNLTIYDFMKRLNIIKPAVSLGGIETTICDPVTTSHAKVSAEVRASQGITDSLLRLSVGIENIEDLIKDIKQALEI